jgi:hypothetical protein
MIAHKMQRMVKQESSIYKNNKKSKYKDGSVKSMYHSFTASQQEGGYEAS